MDEYISKKEVLDYLNGYLHSLGYDNTDLIVNGQRHALINVLEDILTVKAADVQPVKHGQWVSEKVRKPDWKGVEHDYFQPNSCSVCHTGFAVRSNFCPHCGARMDGDAE